MKELYREAKGFKEFLEDGKAEDRDQTLSYLDRIDLDSSLIEDIEALEEEIKVLVVGELWCPDCMINIPALEIMTSYNPKLDYRIVKREGNETAFLDYQLEGKLKIPTFIIMDGNYRILGSILERPQVVKDFYTRGDQLEIIRNSRLYREGYFIKDMVEEVLGYLI